MSQKRKALTKREEIHITDLKKELKGLVERQKELRALEQSYSEKKKVLESDIESFLNNYFGIKRGSSFSLVELIDRAML